MFTLMSYDSSGALDVNFKIPQRIGMFVAIMATTKTDGSLDYELVPLISVD